MMLATQPAQAFIDQQAFAPSSVVLPHQRTGSAAGLPHQAGSALARSGPMGSTESSGKQAPVKGALPTDRTPKRSVKPQASFTGPKVKLGGKLTSPPAPARSRTLDRRSAGSDSAAHGDPHLPGPAAANREITKDRTATTSEFQNPDGTRTARVYSRPVHYRTADGSWADIDTTLTQGSDGRWTEKADTPSAGFAAQGDDPALVTYGPGHGEKVSYGLRGAAAVPGHASGNSITYPGIADHADVTYQATGSGVKETLTLHSTEAPTTWVFPLHLTGLSATLAKDGSVVFKDGSGAVRETIPHGFMEDADKGKVSNEGAVSTGVTYALTTTDGGPALKVSLDSAWLHDKARVFPVEVDPTLSVSSSTYVETPYDINFSTKDTLKVGSYDSGKHKANSYLLFSGFGTKFKNDYIEKASLYLDDVWSGGCTAEPVYAHAITSSWSVSGIADYPGLSYGPTIGSASFAAGSSCGGSAWHGINIGDNPSAAGVKLLEGWAHGGTNRGLALTANNSSIAAWKQFASVHSSYPPYLSVTYSPYGADYSIPKQTYTEPTASTTGSMKVSITNRGTTSWSTSNTQLAADIYSTSWSKLSTNATKTYVPSSVSPNSTITMTGKLPALAPGQYYVCWDMLTSGTSFHSTYSVPEKCAEITSADTPPQIDSTSPRSNSVLGSVTPQLFTTGHDPDNYPGNGLTYDFKVYSNPASGTPSLVAESGWVSAAQWAAPEGDLAWNQSYYWIVADSDGDAQSAWSLPSYFSTAVPQPLITSHLGAATRHDGGRSFDPQVGDYTTAATDAAVSTAGPALDVSRTYNSLDPRSSLLFGAGWSSRYDMSVQPDDDASGSVVVTGADGRQERFGRNSFELHEIAGVGDQTGDGVDDAVAADQTNGKLWLYRGPDYSALTRTLVGTRGWNGMKWLTGGDVTGDGIGDLIGVHTADGTLRMYAGRSGGGLSSPVTIGTGGWNGMADLALTGPLAGDGKKDLVATEISTGKLWAYPVNADGTLASRVEIGTGGWNGMSELMGGDFNGDGHGDVVGVEVSTGYLYLYPGTGSGGLGSRTQIGHSWDSMTDLTSVNGVSGDATTDFLATQKSSGVRFLYHSGPSFSSSSYGGSSGDVRTATAMAVYTSAAGEFETLGPNAGASAGWSLRDKSGSTYTFGEPSGTAWRLTKISDRLGRAENLAYHTDGTLATVTNTTSNRSLHFTWSGGHVTQVATDPATSGGSAETWTYSYSGDDLTGVCPPTSTTACTTYSYTSGSSSGSHYRTAVLDANPASYWRLAESSGTSAASEVAVNEGNDAGTYNSGVSLGTAGPLPGSPTTAATFNGTSGHVSVPAEALHQGKNRAISLWFKTSAPGVLIGDQSHAIDGTTSASGTWAPVLYVGSDDKLHGHWWSGSGTGGTAFGSTGTVTDNAWHHAVLSSDGATQTLYVDGAKQDTFSGAPDDQKNTLTYIGAGYAKYWLDSPGEVSYFPGSIAEVAFFSHALGAPAVSQMYATGSHPTGELTGVTLPSGKTHMTAAYDAVHDRASQITDANGGTWKLSTPSTKGSGAYYRGAVMADAPGDYWRLGESSGSQAVNEVPDVTESVLGWRSNGPGTYHNVTLGASGLFKGGTETAASFNGSSSYVELPYRSLGNGTSSSPFSTELWFKTTTTGGVLFSYQSSQIGTTPSDYTPALYVGANGHLYSQYWDGFVSPMESSVAVTDGTWHQAVLTFASDDVQTLYLDGKQVDQRTGKDFNDTNEGYVSLGAGYLSGSWPSQPSSNSQGYFKGSIAEVSMPNKTLDADTVAAHFAARGAASGATPVTSVTVTDPGGKKLSYRYDPGHSGRLISATDALDDTTSYGYDTDGFVSTVTRPDADYTAYTHNARGDTLSVAVGNLRRSVITSYYTYPADGTYSATDPRNDQPTAYADARSSGPADTTYATAYTYSANGDLLTTKDADGDTTTRTYTTGSETAAGGGTEPAGLLASTQDANGKTTSYAYDSAGDLARVTAPSGLKTSYTYDALGRRLTTDQVSDTYPNGLTTSYTYDRDDRLLTKTAPATTDAVTGTTHTAKTTYTYDDDGNTTALAVSDTTGGEATRTTAWAYNSHDQVDTVTDPLGRKTGYGYDSYGNRVSENDADGNAYSYTYSPTGERLSTTLTNYTGDPVNPSSASSLVLDSRAYDPDGLLASDTDAMGRTTKYVYCWTHWLYYSELTNFHNADGSTTSKYLHVYDYDYAGHVIAEKDTNALTRTDFTVDPAGRTTKRTFDPSGLDIVTSYSYDGDGNLTSQSVTGGSTTEQTDYAHDALGDVTSETVHNGSTNLVTTHTYDQRGVLTSTTDPRGNVTGATAADYTTVYTSDEAGRLTQATAPTVNAETDGNAAQQVHPITLYGYDTFGDQTSVDDADGDITTYTFDADGERVATSSPAYTPPGSTTAITPTTTATYDKAGHVTSVTDGDGNTTSSTYDQLGNLAQVVQPAVGGTSPTTHNTYDTDGELLSVTDPTGAVTSGTYDDLGRALTVSEVVRQPSTVTDTTTYGYDDAGNRTSITLPGGEESKADYDAAGNQLKVTDPLGSITHFSYDLDGRLTKTTLPDGTATTSSYNPAGRLTATARLDASGSTLATTSTAYDRAGNPTSVTDANGNTTTYAYDAADRLTRQTEPASSTSTITTSFGYDAAGQRTRYTDGNGNATITTYNPLGLRESSIEPSTSAFPNTSDRTTTVAYDADGQPVSVTRPGGVSQTSNYDADGRVTSQAGSGAEAATTTRKFGYDADGRITSADAPTGTDTYTYNDRGEITATSGPSGTASYSYNSDGQLASRTDKAGTAAFTYDAAGHLATATEPLTGTTETYTRNSIGQVTSVSYGASGSATQSFHYDAQHRLTGDALTAPGGTTEANTTYGYDTAGHITQQTTTGLAGAAANSYTYDKAGRLTSWNNGTATTTYGYDKAGNRTSTATGSTTTNAAYNARDQLTATTSGQSSTAYSYSARGTLSSVTGTSTENLTYDAFDQLATDGTTTYSHDAFGRLATAGSATFTYNGTDNSIVSDGTDTYSRGPGGGLLGIANTGGAALAYTDQHGDVTATFTATGTSLAGSTAYDPHGSTLATSGTQHSLGYQGGWTDPATGRVATASRWYDPSTGDFTSRDATNQRPSPSVNANPYAYGNDNPLSNADLSGEFSCSKTHHGPQAPVPPPPVRPTGGSPSGARTGGGSSSSGGGRGGAAFDWAAKMRALDAEEANSYSYSDVSSTAGSHGGGWGTAAWATLTVLVSAGAAVAADAATDGAATPADGEIYTTVETGMNWLRDQFTLTSGYYTCNTNGRMVYHPDAGDGLKENPGKKPTGQPNNNESPHQDGTKNANTGPSDTNPVDLQGVAPADVTDPSANQPTGNGGPQDHSLDCVGAPSRLECTGDGNLLDPDTGVIYCNPAGAFTVADGCMSLPSADAGSTPESDGSSGNCSFSPDTKVLMGGGKTKPIGKIKTGDKVEAADPKTGKHQGARTVQHVWINHDRDLLDLTIRTKDGHTATLHTTANHPFWDDTTHTWVPAGKLHRGDALNTADNGHAYVVALRATPGKANRWNLTVQQLHTYYVLAGATPILVHNVCPKLGNYDGAEGTGYGPADDATRVSGPWTKNDIGRGTRGLRPNQLGDRLQIHHADQMPGAPIHELDQDFHLNADIHRNPFNQGVDGPMRRQDTQLHWWYRSMEQGWGSAYGPEAWFDNWPAEDLGGP
ncbi:LamG-like jellyroll fold domain-containing protein [Streptomyces beihaiensis]|uniref:Polymorphic toxin-type HINT domain-containing protein n=1 Tax=Streptomyces beihaiensis TaxID=2984495 RepID=A0ABT3TQQ5_9ACTN|nr:LamG-like jellyroll fold domain-containing protein [Streptomyces beihaiensis]MCX3058378.1 polymorphic toxin-type HINT domain-containing protein [Streptomyces beihaiensis]